MDLDNMLKITTNSNQMSRPIASMHEFYLVGSIGPAEDYIGWFDTIRHAQPDDIVKIYINSEGGNLFTAIQFLRVLTDCAGTVIVSIEGACMSAATMIMLAADAYEISPHTMFMFHNYSGGTIGKGGEMYDNIVHERKWSDQLLHEIYADFLTEEEIEKILDNKDMWMDADEVLERLRARVAKLESTAETVDSDGSEEKAQEQFDLEFEEDEEELLGSDA